MFLEINKSQEKPTTKNKATSPSPLLKGGGSEADGGLPTGGAGPESLIVCNTVDRDTFLPRNKALKPYSSELRTKATPQEQHLWYDFLRNNKPRFTRQRIIGGYIVDFYCHEAALVIELDGSQHYEPEAMEYDKTRTAYLNALGLKVLRFANDEVDRNFSGVCAAITEIVQSRGGKPPPLRGTPFQKGAKTPAPSGRRQR